MGSHCFTPGTQAQDIAGVYDDQGHGLPLVTFNQSFGLITNRRQPRICFGC
jgi:hypothetical protein